jgi:ABC-type transporter Mla subunit MlaD
MLADMPEDYFETMEGMLAQIESGDIAAPQLLAQTADDEVHSNLANLATMLSELDAEELAQVTSFMESNPDQIRDAFAPIIDDLAQVAQDVASQIFPEDAPILSMSQTERESALADFLDQGADLLAQFQSSRHEILSYQPTSN